MKLKSLIVVVIVTVSGLFTSLAAQDYKNAFGLRLGYDNGLTLKHFVSPANALEGILSFSPHYFQLTGLYEYQQPIANAPGLDWFVGIGGHLGGLHKRNHDHGHFLIGVDLIAGLEYTFPSAPFNISLDWKPAFNLNNSYNDYWYAGLALSFRYTFR